MKSTNRYLPGSTINVMIGEAIGVIKAADAANSTVIASGYGETPNCWATLIAIGAMRTAEAVLDKILVSKAVMANNRTNRVCGDASPAEPIILLTIISVPPVCCRASARGNIPASNTRLCQ